MKTEPALEAFQVFGHRKDNTISLSATKNAVIYTRVSTKEQSDKNLSLQFQKRIIEEYANRNSLFVSAYFGGTYESAKTDGRKEFLRMLEYVRKNKGKVSHILVYTLDRFSRTGGGAIKLAQDLREKYGVRVLAVTQPGDTSNPSGVLHQNIQLLFGEFDNQLRRQRAIDSLKGKYENGIWSTRVPQGYDIVKLNGEKKIVVNETGKKLRRAFHWKAEGMKNEEIIKRLRAMGVRMYKQQLTKIFKKPFYCGIINHKLLDGRITEGTHEKLVSREIFLKANDLHRQAANYGVPHKKELDEVPLKVFIKCGDCGEPFTGYVVKAKNLWYYKCRTKGCRCNKNAGQIHKQFEQLLADYTLKPEAVEPVKYQMTYTLEKFNEANTAQEKTLTEQLAQEQKKLHNIEEKYYALNEMNREVFERLQKEYTGNITEISQQLQQSRVSISNHEQWVEKVVDFSLKLPVLWTSSSVSGKEKLQKLVFPEGIVYDRKNGLFRTPKVNAVFSAIAQWQGSSGGNEEGTNHSHIGLSLSAETEGFEPSIPFRGIHTFQACSFNHSDKSPKRRFRPGGRQKYKIPAHFRHSSEYP